MGLSTVYKDREDVKMFCGKLDGLAFLPVDKVRDGMAYLRTCMPDYDGIVDLVDYFAATYVSGSVRSLQRPVYSSGVVTRLRLRRLPAMFPPEKWNLNNASLSGGPRTHNECESWNNSHHQLIGHSHPSVWTAIEAFQIDQAMVTSTLLLYARGQPPVKRVSCVTINTNARLQTLCTRLRHDDIDITCFLEGVKHLIRLG
jgi:hypothetical protein